MAEGEQLPTLGPTGRDRAIALARGIAGAVPFAGAAIAELITEIVPGQRQERIEDWLRHLAERLVGVEETVLRKRLRKLENVALFEEGAYQADRAFTEERRRQIAELVAGGIADERREYVESHRVLRLLEELDDGEVVLLAGLPKQEPARRVLEATVPIALDDFAANLDTGRESLQGGTKATRTVARRPSIQPPHAVRPIGGG